ncbi:MAG: hypothetical protein LBI05_07720 [Planctomycetaceae bacterium]|jgi:hypothetical protein|nr:hypothetical protein [Planctomycetaceae bacterium]
MKKFDFTSFSFFGNNSNNSTKKRAAKQRQGRQCRIEELEGREMLNADPAILLSSDGLDDEELYDNDPSDIVQVQVAESPAAIEGESSEVPYEEELYDNVLSDIVPVLASSAPIVAAADGWENWDDTKHSVNLSLTGDNKMLVTWNEYSGEGWDDRFERYEIEVKIRRDGWDETIQTGINWGGDQGNRWECTSAWIDINLGENYIIILKAVVRDSDDVWYDQRDWWAGEHPFHMWNDLNVRADSVSAGDSLTVRWDRTQEDVRYNVIIRGNNGHVDERDVWNDTSTTFSGLGIANYTIEVRAYKDGYEVKEGSTNANVSIRTMENDLNPFAPGVKVGKNVIVNWTALRAGSETVYYNVVLTGTDINGNPITQRLDDLTGTSATFSNLPVGVYSISVTARADWKYENKSATTTVAVSVIEVDTNAKSKPVVKAGNGTNGANKPTVSTVEFTLDKGSTAVEPVNYVVGFSFTKKDSNSALTYAELTFPKTGFMWNGTMYANTPMGKYAFMEALNAEIRIVKDETTGKFKAVVSGLPAGMKFSFSVRSEDAEGNWSAETIFAISTVKYAATKVAVLKTDTRMTSATLITTPVTVDVSNIAYRMVVSYVSGTGKAGNPKITHFCVIEVRKDGSTYPDGQTYRILTGDEAAGKHGATSAEIAVACGLKADASMRYEDANSGGLGSILKAEMKLGYNTTVESKNSGTPRDCITISGLSAATKYTISLQAVAGNKQCSVASKITISTLAYAATKIANNALQTKMTSVVLNPTAPKMITYTDGTLHAIDEGFTVKYQTMITFVVKIGKVNTTVYGVIEVGKDSSFRLFSADEAIQTGLPGTLKGATMSFQDYFSAADLAKMKANVGEFEYQKGKTATTTGIQILGLLHSTKYTFLMRTVASNGSQTFFSATAKAAATTVKFSAPKVTKTTYIYGIQKIALELTMDKNLGVVADFCKERTQTLQFRVYLADSTGNPEDETQYATLAVAVEMCDLSKGLFMGELDLSGLATPWTVGNQKYVIRAVTTGSNSDGGEGIFSAEGAGTFKIPAYPYPA